MPSDADKVRFLRYLSLKQEQRIRQGRVTLRAGWNYNSPKYVCNDLEVDCATVVPGNPIAVAIAMRRIKDLVTKYLSAKVAAKLHFGISPATSVSETHFMFRRGVQDWWKYMS